MGVLGPPGFPRFPYSAPLRPGESARLLRISEVAEHEAPDLLQFLTTHHFTLNGHVEMIEESRGAGTVTVGVGGQRVSMSNDAARKIWVDAS